MRHRRVAALLAFLVLSLGGIAAAQEELSLSLGAGTFLPGEKLGRRVYGNGFVWAAELWLKLKGPFGLAAGLEVLSDEGLAAPMFEGDSEEYRVKLTRRTVPVLAFYQLDLGDVCVRAGAGVAIHGFRETWQSVELDYKGSGFGPHFLLAARVRLPSRLYFLGSIAYDSFRAGEFSPNAMAVNLGGFEIRCGLGFRIY